MAGATLIGSWLLIAAAAAAAAFTGWRITSGATKPAAIAGAATAAAGAIFVFAPTALSAQAGLAAGLALGAICVAMTVALAATAATRADEPETTVEPEVMAESEPVIEPEPVTEQPEAHDRPREPVALHPWPGGLPLVVPRQLGPAQPLQALAVRGVAHDAQMVWVPRQRIDLHATPFPVLSKPAERVRPDADPHEPFPAARGPVLASPAVRPLNKSRRRAGASSRRPQLPPLRRGPIAMTGARAAESELPPARESVDT